MQSSNCSSFVPKMFFRWFSFLTSEPVCDFVLRPDHLPACLTDLDLNKQPLVWPNSLPVCPSLWALSLLIWFNLWPSFLQEGGKGSIQKQQKSIGNSKHSSVRQSWVTTEGAQTLKTTIKSQLTILSMWTPTLTSWRKSSESRQKLQCQNKTENHLNKSSF